VECDALEIATTTYIAPTASPELPALPLPPCMRSDKRKMRHAPARYGKTCAGNTFRALERSETRRCSSRRSGSAAD
jgi:hypothetical protein